MDEKDRAAVLWGVVGALSFLVLIQGYELLTGVGVDALVKAVVALVVGTVTTVSARRLQPRLFGA
jgi:hypothetical protein